MSLWLVLIVVLIAIEVVTPLDLTTVWFLPAVIVSYLLDLMNIRYSIIITTFIILSFIGFIFMYLYFKKKQNGKDLVKNKFDGNFKILSIASNGMGKIKVKDIYYFVIEENNNELQIGDEVIAMKIQGNKIIVRKVN